MSFGSSDKGIDGTSAYVLSLSPSLDLNTQDIALHSVSRAHAGGYFELTTPTPRDDETKVSESPLLVRPPFRRATAGAIVTPNARFRQAVLKVIRMRRLAGLEAGEPGVDVNNVAAHALFRHVHQRCKIQIVDYGPTKCSLATCTNEQLLQYMAEENRTRPLWAKNRWISVCGISFDVIKALANRYLIHPLAIEDILHGRNRVSSKAEYFATHMFVRILCHTLADDDEEALEQVKLASKLENPRAPDGGWDPQGAEATLNALKHGSRVEIRIRNVYVVFFRDGTLISFHPDPQTHVFNPLLTRLQQRDSIIRSAGDASILLQSIIGIVVDHGVKIVDRYQSMILKFERDILLKPKFKTVTSLQIMAEDIQMHKRTVGSLKPLVDGLRRYDLDRAIAASDAFNAGYDEKPVVGYMSHKSKVYLGDALDRMDYISESFDMFHAITESRIAHTFNVVSYNMNTTMRTLTVATVISIPLSFLTGYFGMDLQGAEAPSQKFFWTLTLPILFVTLVAFSLGQIVDFFHAMHKHGPFHWMQRFMLERRLKAMSR